MKKLVVFLFTLVILAGCGAQPAQQTQVENVTIQISDITPTGATVTITDTNEAPYLYGEWYKIQRLTNDGWQDLPTVIDNYGFHLMGYIPDKNGEVKFAINWEWLYGTLPPGAYRIFKEVNRQEISIEFQI